MNYVKQFYGAHQRINKKAKFQVSRQRIYAVKILPRCVITKASLLNSLDYVLYYISYSLDEWMDVC